MTYQETHQIRRLCFQYEIRFYITKDRHDDYTVQLYVDQAANHWKISDYASAVNCIDFLLQLRSRPDIPTLHMN